MALTSPGVEVTITDQSQYLPAPGGSVPLVILATAQNKADASGTGVAAATTAANAGKLYQITSQRDLVNLYGSPFFYSTTNGTPIQGYELNEYGLLAAYSTLGVTNRCYVLRADIDLASLVGQTGRPVGFPENNTYWLDTTSSTWGIYAFNQTTGKFALQTPIVITNPDDLTAGTPNSSIGNIGDYAVNALETAYSYSSDPTNREFFYKSSNNSWVPLGGLGWKRDVPTILGTTSNPTLTSGTITIDLDGIYSTTITVPVSPNNNVYGMAAEINNLNWSQLKASVRNNKLCIFSAQSSSISGSVAISQTGTVLDELGIVPKTYFQASVVFGTAAEMPLWTSSQAEPHPTGSVWIKVGQAGNGLAPVVANFNSITNIWQNKNVSLATSDADANANLDATGGQLIPAGSIYAQYDPSYVNGPLYLWERIATGPTVVTGSVSNPTLNNGPYTMTVQTSVPASSTLSSGKTNLSLTLFV